MVGDDCLIFGFGWLLVLWLETALAKGFETIVSLDFDEVLTLSVRLKMIGFLFHWVSFHCFFRKMGLTLFRIVVAFSFVARLHNIAQRMKLEKAIDLQMIDGTLRAD